MRRTRFAAVVLLVRVVLALALLPLIAYAATDSGYEGTYEGVAQGTDVNGKGGSSDVIVWVEQDGDNARFTIQASRLGITIATEGPATVDGDTVTVPFEVDSMGVSGSGTMTLVKGGENWVLTGVGQGGAVGYEGSGSLQAQRVSTGFGLPPIGEQFSTMISGIVGGPGKVVKQATAQPTTQTAKETAGQTAEETVDGIPATDEAVDATAGTDEGVDATAGTGEEVDGATEEQWTGASVSVEPAQEQGALAPATPEPPLADDDKLIAAGLALLVLILQIILA